MEKTNRIPQEIPAGDMDACDECGIEMPFDALMPMVQMVEGRAVFDRLVCRPCEAGIRQAQDAAGEGGGR